MKLGLLSESPADEAALCILLGAVAGTKIESVQPPLRARGWPNVMQVLPAVMHHLQFQTDAVGLVVVVDSDDTTLHDADHADPNRFHPQCRLCQLEMTIRRARKRWVLPPGRAPLHTAVGLAVPAVEGWYLFGRDSEVGEEGWRRARERDQPRYTRRDLKFRTYGTIRPPLALETQRAEEEARRLARDIHALEREFPIGFGSMAHAVRRWRLDRGQGGA